MIMKFISKVEPLEKNYDIYFSSFLNAILTFFISGPEHVTGVNVPDYHGFEKDVFKVVHDYFDNLAEPLFPFRLYSTVIHVMGGY